MYYSLRKCYSVVNRFCVAFLAIFNLSWSGAMDDAEAVGYEEDNVLRGEGTFSKVQIRVKRRYDVYCYSIGSGREKEDPRISTAARISKSKALAISGNCSQCLPLGKDRRIHVSALFRLFKTSEYGNANRICFLLNAVTSRSCFVRFLNIFFRASFSHLFSVMFSLLNRVAGG